MGAPDNLGPLTPDKGCYQGPEEPQKSREIAPFSPVAPAITDAVRIDPTDVAGAFARNTRRAYSSDWKSWMNWCGTNNRNAIPASPADIADYLKERVAGGLKVASAKRAVAAIAKVHQLAGVHLDRDDAALHLALKRLAREYGMKAHGRAALMTADIEAMLEVLRGDGLGCVRDRAILLIGFASGLRRSELAGLDVSDIAWQRDGIMVSIDRSKGDQEGRGQFVAVKYGLRERTCPVRALKRWLNATGLTEGPLFRPIHRGRAGDHRISGDAISDAVKSAARRAGLAAGDIAAHSLRAGHTTQALENGADPVAVQRQLRHKKLDTTLEYDRRGAALRTSSSGKLGL